MKASMFIRVTLFGAVLGAASLFMFACPQRGAVEPVAGLTMELPKTEEDTGGEAVPGTINFIGLANVEALNMGVGVQEVVNAIRAWFSSSGFLSGTLSDGRNLYMIQGNAGFPEPPFVQIIGGPGNLPQARTVALLFRATKSNELRAMLNRYACLDLMTALFKATCPGADSIAAREAVRLFIEDGGDPPVLNENPRVALVRANAAMDYFVFSVIGTGTWEVQEEPTAAPAKEEEVVPPTEMPVEDGAGK